MALSRFWSVIIILSVLYIFGLLVSGNTYSIDYIVNGHRDDRLLIKEVLLTDIAPPIKDSITLNNGTWTQHNGTAASDTLYTLSQGMVRITAGRQVADGMLPTARSAILDLLLPLIAYLAFFSGILQLLIDSGASEKLARFLSPVFVKVFPDVPAGHPAISYMTLNFAANFLGLDSAATPFGLRAMESLQELNSDKDRASNAQIMFLCLHAAGLTLIPTSIIGYRAAQNAQNPADVMLPCIITSFVGTLVALLLVGIRQRINFRSGILILSLGGIMGVLAGLMWYITRLGPAEKSHFTANISNIILLGIILLIVVYAMFREKVFGAAGKNIFSSFVDGVQAGVHTGVTIFPYILGMLVAISLFRNSGVFEIISGFISKFFLMLHVDRGIVDALPVAILRPFSSSGSRGFMIDAMQTYGVDSLTARLSCVFQCSAETTFYVIAVYFGSVRIRNTRYTLSTMLLVDLACIIAAIVVCSMFF